jgi:phage head maturation protease
VELFEDAKGLFLEAILVDTVKAQEDRKLITSGVVKELSVGIIPLQIKRMTKKETLDYWKKAGYSPSEEELMRSESGSRLIKRAKLLEISPVALGANEQTTISSFKAGRKISQTTADLLAQVCAQVKASYEMLETLLVDAGIKSESEEDEAEAQAQAKVAVEDPLNDLLEAFRAYIKE